MLLLRILVPPEQAATVLAYLEGLEIATDLLYLAGAARKPAGDVVQCTVPREAASAVVGALKELGIDRHGSISLDNLDATVSQAADEAEEEAAGTTADAVVWEEVERRADAMATLSGAFVVYMAAATVIARLMSNSEETESTWPNARICAAAHMIDVGTIKSTARRSMPME